MTHNNSIDKKVWEEVNVQKQVVTLQKSLKGSTHEHTKEKSLNFNQKFTTRPVTL